MSQWMPECRAIGGPVDVDLDACFKLNSGCGAFKKGNFHKLRLPEILVITLIA